ncbi:hypothetical protein ACVDG5_018210 [Mesorhizobium sp. ORM6]
MSDLINRLQDAVEGECDGLAIDADQARAILDHLDFISRPTEIWQPVEPEGWFLHSAANEHTRIIYNGDKHKPLPHANGPWKVEFQRLPYGGRLTGARGTTFREAWENACAAVAQREAA